MKLNTKLAGSAAAIVIGSTFLLAAPAQAAQTSYEQSSAMAEVVANQGAQSMDSQPEQRGVVGVAKALAAGFKAATAPQAAGNVARLASILGFAAEAPQPSAQLESAYFDR
ncbi:MULTISPECIES: hypothetical protein [Curtobacterium]|jgi:hypothetical protein|uniref:hypothetical protein n=1 Tax=Curtobacterium TaxID=2034 RepID=UPI0008F8423E|nr:MULTISPECIES: hypothetical protein [Curtobacterium]MBT1632741.1 hypothetical protein [Curtobacterium flaccumfaciens pv. oortii]MCS5506775.1 hypothetical protein [Curtobacterium flaccumfaciens pv. flaccumfaciens]MCX2846079.1 hypothetical protein [Curtobacterium flaccumfaciens pv. oortii]NQX25046.1 hypothetical protein [Curtobacterium sp. VKM Ac-2852]OII34068.1 hypothetical protein BIU91_05025 [Curtobacterium sp. MMLR14_002]